MAQLKTLNPDVREQKLVFALMLLDRFTETAEPVGKLTVRIASQPFEPPFVAVQQPGQASFFFFDLPPAAYTLQVRSNRDGKVDDAKPPQEDEPPYYYFSEAPYYFPVDIPIVVPPPNGQWPAFPNLLLANQTIPLTDPAQPAAFRDQRALATLQPTTSYPFPTGASLLRGRVLASGNPLANARVRRFPIPINDDLEYRTGPDGYYVLFFNKVKGAEEQITVRASHVSQPDKDQPVTIRRGMTVTQNIVMAP
jgi:hypothetical protein